VLPLLFAAACSGGGDDTQDSAGKGSASSSPSGSAGAQSIDALLATGLQQVKDTQYPEATATFRKVLGLDPKNTFATYNLGYLAQLQGDDVTALQRYAATLDSDRTFAPALYNLAILTEPSDLHAAVALYRRDIAVKPDDAPAYMRLGFALKHLGQDEEADQLLQRGVQLDPSLAGAAPPTYR
jgi:Flp pilus assembly protein TadD